MRRSPVCNLEAQGCAWGPLSPRQIWWGLDFTHRWGGQKCWVFCLCLSACVYVTPLNARTVRPILPWRHWSTETILIPLDRVRFVVMHCTSVQLSQIAANCRHHNVPNSKKNRQNLGFSLPEGDGINRSRRNLARKRRPCVCSSTPNLALISKEAGYISPPKWQNLPKIVDSDVIWHVSVDSVSTVWGGIWPRSVKRDWHQSPQNMKIWLKLLCIGGYSPLRPSRTPSSTVPLELRSRPLVAARGFGGVLQNRQHALNP